MAKKSTSSTSRAYTLSELAESVEACLLTSADPEALDLRPPSIPTLKNLSRVGIFKNETLTSATQLVIEHLKRKSRFYSKREVRFVGINSEQHHHEVTTPIFVPIAQEDGFNEKLVTLIKELIARVDGLERLVKQSLTATSAQTHPAVLSAIHHLEDTRRHVMTQLDAQRQGEQKGTAPREFESASAMDAQRILAGISRLNDKVSILANDPNK